MEGNKTLKYDFLVFVSGSILLLHCCVHFSVPLDKWILISYEYILHVHIFSFSVGKRMFRDQCAIFWLILMLFVLILTFHGVNMFRTSCNLAKTLVLVYGMCFLSIVLLRLSLWHFLILSSFWACSVWNRNINEKQKKSFQVATPLSKLGNELSAN